MNEEKRKKLIKWLTVDNDLQIKTCMEVVKFNGIEINYIKDDNDGCSSSIKVQ